MTARGVRPARKRFCFFDLDGTLADTDPDIRRSWNAALADLGLECPDFDEKFVAGPPIDEMTRILFPGIFTASLADAVRRSFAAHYDNDGFPLTREYPGVLDEVRRLKSEGRTLAIVTNKRFAAATAMARHFGWLDAFDGVYAGDMRADGPSGKMRKPELLRAVMAEFGATTRRRRRTASSPSESRGATALRRNYRAPTSSAGHCLSRSEMVQFPL